MAEPTPDLLQRIASDKLRAALETPPDQRILMGPRLFAHACRVTLAGIRSQHPDADEAEVRRILLDRLALARKLDDLPLLRDDHAAPTG
jgi:hypothetical protein